MLVAEALLVACLLLSLLGGDTLQRRRVRFPLVLAAINVGFFVVAKRPEEHLDYYYLKTSFQPFLLALIAAGCVALRAAARALDDARFRSRGLACVGVFVLALGAGSYATRMWRESYVERVRREAAAVRAHVAARRSPRAALHRPYARQEAQGPSAATSRASIRR